MKNKKIAAAGLIAGLVAGAGAGLALELSGSAGAANSGAAVTPSAEGDATIGTGTDTGTVRPDRTARLQEVLQPLIDAGTIDQSQADAVIAALEAAGPIGGHGGPGGREGRGGMHLTVVAETIGITDDAVRTAVQGGETIADLAAANGSSAQAVIDALLAEVKAHLADEVAAGEHTQAEADARLADATSRITEFVNNTQAAGPMGGGRGHGPGHMGGDDIDQDATVTTTGA